MARKRMIDPEFWLDEEISNLTPHARLLYIGIWSICDDNYATFPDRPDWIRAQIFPYDSVNVSNLLGELEKIGKITSFEDKGKKFWHLKNFFKHQRVDRPSTPKYPRAPGVLYEPSSSTRPEVKLREVKRSEVKTLATHSVAGDRINKLIEAFAVINPGYQKLFARKTERNALESLVDAHGYEEVERLIKLLPEVIYQRYGPTITTPSQLSSKHAQLLAFIKKNDIKNEASSEIVVAPYRFKNVAELLAAEKDGKIKWDRFERKWVAMGQVS